MKASYGWRWRLESGKGERGPYQAYGVGSMLVCVKMARGCFLWWIVKVNCVVYDGFMVDGRYKVYKGMVDLSMLIRYANLLAKYANSSVNMKDSVR